jgi:hypothetical protein
MKQAILSKTEKAQSMVEFALFYLMLLILLSGVIDLGRAFFAFMALRDAAQEGATYASLYPADTDGPGNGMEQRVRNSSNNPVDFSNMDITVNAFPSGALCHGNGIRVEVEWPNFPLIFPYWQVFTGINTISLHAEVTDTILRPPCQ